MAVTEDIKKICNEFIIGLKDIIFEKLYATYVYGAAAFPDTLPTGDIDFHVILKTSLSELERSSLAQFHDYLAKRFPPLGGELDGYYILIKDAIQNIPPQSEMWEKAIDTAWALHRQHILAGRYIHLYGPKPEKIYLSPTWVEIKTALVSELDYIYKNLLRYPDYCILNLCRIIYSFKTKDVVISKDKASIWALNYLIEWKKIIEIARKSYMHMGSEEERQCMIDNVTAFYNYVLIRINNKIGNT